METEPRVLTADVKRVLEQALSKYDADDKESVQLIAERAGTSTRTIYRVLGERTEDLLLDTADRLVVAAGGHLSECRVRWPDGTVESA